MLVAPLIKPHARRLEPRRLSPRTRRQHALVEHVSCDPSEDASEVRAVRDESGDDERNRVNGKERDQRSEMTVSNSVDGNLERKGGIRPLGDRSVHATNRIGARRGPTLPSAALLVFLQVFESLRGTAWIEASSQ